MNNNKYQICSRCIMDTTADNIVFDTNGVCNYCNDFLTKYSKLIFQNNNDRIPIRNKYIEEIKRNGSKKKYDCIIGLSGGVDSSWVLYLAVKNGLRPLAVHMDNGWDSELAQSNIENLVRNLKVDLYTHVIDWDEYRELMQAFFDSDVVDIELLYDNAMTGVNYQQAAKYNVSYILGGMNASTEGIKIPLSWNWFKMDARNIWGIYHKFNGSLKIKTFPSIGRFKYLYYRRFCGIQWEPFLDYFDYNKKIALETLTKEIDYKPYPYKHYESVFTRFYQGHILPVKFNIDKRKLHLSNLIVSKQMSREEALAMLEKPPYPSENLLNDDINYFLRKMGWAKKDLDSYFKRPRKEHDDYPSEKMLWTNINKYKRRIQKLCCLGK